MCLVPGPGWLAWVAGRGELPRLGRQRLDRRRPAGLLLRRGLPAGARRRPDADARSSTSPRSPPAPTRTLRAARRLDRARRPLGCADLRRRQDLRRRAPPASGPVASIGTAPGTATYGLGTGATASGATKTVNLGTGGAAGSDTVVNIGSDTLGADGELVVNTPTVTFAGNGVTFARHAPGQPHRAVARPRRRGSRRLEPALGQHAGGAAEQRRRRKVGQHQDRAGGGGSHVTVSRYVPGCRRLPLRPVVASREWKSHTGARVHGAAGVRRVDAGDLRARRSWPCRWPAAASRTRPHACPLVLDANFTGAAVLSRKRTVTVRFCATSARRLAARTQRGETRELVDRRLRRRRDEWRARWGVAGVGPGRRRGDRQRLRGRRRAVGVGRDDRDGELARAAVGVRDGPHAAAGDRVHGAVAPVDRRCSACRSRTRRRGRPAARTPPPQDGTASGPVDRRRRS